MLKKSPQQERSRALVDSILEAATRILSARRLHEISTNHIAEVAGVGIGSLYQYFDSKEAIAESLLERHQVDSIAHANAVLLGSQGRVVERYRVMMRELLALHERSRCLHLNLIQLNKHGVSTSPAVNEHIGLTCRLLREESPWMSEVSCMLHAHVLMRSVHTLVHCAVQLEDAECDRIALEHYDMFALDYGRLASSRAAPVAFTAGK